MKLDQLPKHDRDVLDALLGYLNFSSGTSDAGFLTQLNEIYRLFNHDSATDAASPTRHQPWKILGELLLERLDQLRIHSETFHDVTQVDDVIKTTHRQVLPAYREFHRDLLFHQDETFLFGPLFLGRVYEAVLQTRHEYAAADPIGVQEGLLDESIRRVLERLNDYVGYRPVAVLENQQRIEPYPHERCRPVPIYIREVGAATGPYKTLIDTALGLLQSCSSDLREEAYFRLEHLDELAVDPRAYDFDHPAHKRPNHQFGGWDPHQIDNDGYYRRFVVQQVTLDALLSRTKQLADGSYEERLFESAAALGGIILMASGISGSGPETHRSDVTLPNLLSRIVVFRDAFYEQLLEKRGATYPRLLEETTRTRQPFGGVRQYLNAVLARQRASQLEHFHLAKLYARMGYSQAAQRIANKNSTASARFVGSIWRKTAEAQRALDCGRYSAASELLSVVIDLLHGGIECGAIVDPWNILGFDANFSLFPSPENSVRDHRVDELLEMMDQLFSAMARTWSLTAAANDVATKSIISEKFQQLAGWWDQFAVTTVSSVNGVAAGPICQAASVAAEALEAWYGAGTMAGDVAFWGKHVEQFHSPKAYVLVLDALLDHKDLVAAMNLLTHWLGQSARVQLQKGSDMYHTLALRWLDEVVTAEPAQPAPSEHPHRSAAAKHGLDEQRWQLIEKFFDFSEANADDYWQVPQLRLDVGTTNVGSDTDDDATDEDDLYSAAYDGVTYRDTTDDGVFGDVLGDGAPATDMELELESRRISERLMFLITLARLWKHSAQAVLDSPQFAKRNNPVTDRMRQWADHVSENHRQLDQLLESVSHCELPKPTAAPTSLIDYDHRRVIHEVLQERIIAASIHYSEAKMLLSIASRTHDAAKDDEDVAIFRDVLRAALDGNVAEVRERFESVLAQLAREPLLYIPLARSGDASHVARIRSRHWCVHRLLSALPRLGMFDETIQLLTTLAETERNKSVGPGAITEFDDLFNAAHGAIVNSVINCAEQWSTPPTADGEPGDVADDADSELVDLLQELTHKMSGGWIGHSRATRLSVLEKVADKKSWKRVVEFVQRFGSDLLNQSFFHLGNLRSILHMGVDVWLHEIKSSGDDNESLLLEALDEKGAQETIIEPLRIAIEAVIENYAEYRDYNSTTTQSDRGELFHGFLDMLRLRAAYDRVAWNLSPVILTHEVLVRRRRRSAADIWRRELIQRTEEIADELTDRLDKLEREYGMRLSTVADRLGERFVRCLAIDQARALVQPAISEARESDSQHAFEELDSLVSELLQRPTGAGLDVPAWLEALESEVDSALTPIAQRRYHEDTWDCVPQRLLTREELQRQLEAM